METKLTKLSKALDFLGLKKETVQINELLLSNSFEISDQRFVVKRASCQRETIKLAEFISKIASTYYGKGGAGVLLICQEDGTALLLKRSRSVEQPLTWGIPGGAVSEGWHDSKDIKPQGFTDSDFKETAIRETKEELFSKDPENPDFERTFKNLFNEEDLVGQTDFTDGGFTYRTYIYNITLDEKRLLTPLITLNWENTRAKWYSLSSLPMNLHPGVSFTKEKLREGKVNIFKERKDEFDWLRDWLEALKIEVGEEGKNAIEEFILKVDRFPKKMDVIRETSVWDITKRFNRNNETRAFLQKLAKRLSELSERKAAIKVLNFSATAAPYQKTENDYPEEKRMQTIPRGELSSHQGFFYHGLPLQNAASILKSKCFFGTGAFTRLSLTTDLLLSGKFGDVVFVFDAAKLQRQGAKKMNYGSLSEIRGVERNLELSGRNITVDENNMDYPWISDIYRYEKEWVMKLPFCFSDQLVKVIYFSRDVDSVEAKKVFGILDELTDVPVEILGYPSIGKHEPSESKMIQDIQPNIIDTLYRNVFSKQGDFEKLKELYDRESGLRLSSEEYRGDPGFLISYDPIRKLLQSLNYKSKNIGSYARQLSFESLYDSNQVSEYYNEIRQAKNTAEALLNQPSYILNVSWLHKFKSDQELLQFMEPYLKNIIELCDGILKSEEDFKKMIRTKHFGRSETESESMPEKEKYIVTYFVHPSGTPKLILDRAREWCSENISQILSIPDIKSYLNESGPKVWGTDWSWYSKEKLDDYSISSKIEELIKMSNPALVPDDIFVKYYLGLIDQDRLSEISDERLLRISARYLNEGTPKYSGGEKYSYDWIKNYRYPYAKSSNKSKLKIMIEALGGFVDEAAEEEEEGSV